jgi:2-dehydropantoate 2-reductase
VGGVGGYFGARIAAAFALDPLAGRQVYFIARGEHLKALEQNGITLKTTDRTFLTRPALATSSYLEIPTPDLVLLCTKSYDLDSAVANIGARTSPTTIIIPLLNGIDIYERIRTRLPSGIILPACVYLGTHIESPGVISQNGGNGVILTGPDPRFPLFTADNVRQFFKGIGIGLEWQASPYPAIWEKYLFIAAFGMVTASSGLSLGAVAADPELHRTTEAIMREIVSLAGRQGIQLAEDIVEKSLAKAHNFPFEARTSYQRDVAAWPKPNEGDLYGGTLIRLGTEMGVSTPVIAEVETRILQRFSRNEK